MEIVARIMVVSYRLLTHKYTKEIKDQWTEAMQCVDLMVRIQNFVDCTTE